MHLHTATVRWQRADDEPFVDRRYHRAHTMHFDGGAVVPGSSSPQVVRVPYSDPAAVDPEEAFVASLSSCHLLWFLDFASRAGLRVDAYEDEATGVLAEDAQGREAITRVTLRPRVRFGTPVDADLHARLHHEAHAHCFIANSVRCEVACEPAFL